MSFSKIETAQKILHSQNRTLLNQTLQSLNLENDISFSTRHLSSFRELNLLSDRDLKISNTSNNVYLSTDDQYLTIKFIVTKQNCSIKNMWIYATESILFTAISTDRNQLNWVVNFSTQRATISLTNFLADQNLDLSGDLMTWNEEDYNLFRLSV